MERITKSEFIRTITENLTTFVGNARNITEDTLEAKLDSLQFYDDEILEKRTATARATFVEFSGGSRLYLNQAGKYEFFRNIGPAWGNPMGGKARFVNGKSGAEFVAVKYTETLSDGEDWTRWTVYLVHR